MDPVRSSLGGGIAATLVLTGVLLLVDVLFGGTTLLQFTTFTSLCAIGGPPYCEVATPLAAALTFGAFLALFTVAWPLLFGGFTWGLPGRSGHVHGAIFGLVLWAGYVVVLYGVGIAGTTATQRPAVAAVSFLAYLVYGTVLGSVYDRLAEHRTFLSPTTV